MPPARTDLLAGDRGQLGVEPVDAGLAGLDAAYDATTSSFRSNCGAARPSPPSLTASCSSVRDDWSAVIAVGATGGLRAARPSIWNAPELATATAPRAAATGAH